MNRFLKEEWDKTKIPPQVLWRTRNQAWRRLQKRRRSRFWTAAAALASLSALLLAWVSYSTLPVAPPNESVANLPPLPGLSERKAPPAPLPGQDVASSDAPAQQRRQVHNTRTIAEKPTGASPVTISEAASTASVEQAPVAQVVHAASDSRRFDQQRLVMNFRLPRSGVRMIWINQKSSDSTSGGTG